MKMKNIAYFFIIAVGVILTLIYGQNILIQLIIASLLWFITLRLKKMANKMKWFRFIPAKLQLVVILGLLMFILYLLFNAVFNSLSGLMSSFPQYESNINVIAAKIETLLNVNLKDEITTVLKSLDVKGILSQLAEGFSNVLSQTLMVLIFLLFIFLETNSFKLKIAALFPQASNKQKFMDTVENIETSLSGYFRVKTLMSLLTGFLSFIILISFGVDAALFWAFLVFMLNYIPSIGSLIATVFTAAFTLLQFGDFLTFTLVLALITSVQVVVGNLIEPRLMGKSLNVSPMVTIIALALWGKIWGVMGLLLSVPITVVMIIIFSQFKATQKIAIILSEKGNLSSNKSKEPEK